MKKQLMIGLFSLTATAGWSAAQAEPQNPMASGQAMAWQCAPCHGTNGQQFLEAMPPLAGMPEEQFIRAMLAFRDDSRPAVIMDRVARGFTDDEIKAMAVWFKAQPSKQWDNTRVEEMRQANPPATSQGGQ